jgi:hypothetical protein
MAGHIFEEDKLGSALHDDASDMGPQVARVFRSLPLSGLAEGLAGVASRDDIHRATPWAAVEGGKIIPDRRWIQRLVVHPGHESGRSVGFPLDVTNSLISGIGDMEPKLQPPGTGAHGKPSQRAGGR